jgi:RNA polymerase sigma-70 factor (ECF subfamily)
LEINNQKKKQKKVIKRPLPSIESLLNEVYGFMLKRIENEASAEDITIETFSKALTRLHHITLNSSLTPG